TTPHLLATSTPSPLLELRGVHHPQHLSTEHQNLPRRRLHGGYDAKDAAAALSRLNFALSSGTGSEVDSRDLDIASSKDNGGERRRRCRPIKVSSGPHLIPPNLRRLRIRQWTTN
ncbi:hypothetical protein ZWY2020_031571, partial [Hordeum vulgare]